MCLRRLVCLQGPTMTPGMFEVLNSKGKVLFFVPVRCFGTLQGIMIFVVFVCQQEPHLWNVCSAAELMEASVFCSRKKFRHTPRCYAS